MVDDCKAYEEGSYFKRIKIHKKIKKFIDKFLIICYTKCSAVFFCFDTTKKNQTAICDNQAN